VTKPIATEFAVMFPAAKTGVARARLPRTNAAANINLPNIEVFV